MLTKEGECNGWSTYDNFIDKNDNFVGYDMNGQCCEYFGWTITKIAGTSENSTFTQGVEPGLDIENYSFDTSVEPQYEGDAITFKMIDEEGNAMYLNLYNEHNGYYSHG